MGRRDKYSRSRFSAAIFIFRGDVEREAGVAEILKQCVSVGHFGGDMRSKNG